MMRITIPMKRVENDRKTTLTHDFIPGHEYEVVVRALGPDGVAQAMEAAVRETIVIQGKEAAPATGLDLTATGFLNSIQLTWTNPSDPDFYAMEVWRSSTNTIASASKLTDAFGAMYIDVVDAPDLTYYYWIRAVDTSGNTSTYHPTTSAGVAGTSDGVTATDIDDFSITATKMFTNTIILSGDVWTDDSPVGGSVAWNAHTLVHNGISYSIDAGSASGMYVFWYKSHPSLPNTEYTGADTHPDLGNTGFMIAVNRSGTHEMVWNSSANMIIGSAWIMDAAITNAKIDNLAVTEGKIAALAVTNAKINSLSASKLTAGTIDASVITVSNLDADNITAGSITLSRVSDAGDLAAQDTIGTTDCDTTIISGGKIVTGLLTADNIQTGTLATTYTAAKCTDPTADRTSTHTAKDIQYLPATPSGAGLYADSSHLGYHSGSSWQSYIGSDGKFYFQGDASNYITWDGSTLDVRGALTADDITAGTLTGRTVQTASGTGQRIVADSSDNTLKWYNSSNILKVAIDDGLGGGSDGYIWTSGKIYADSLTINGGLLAIWDSGYTKQLAIFDEDGLSYKATDATGGIGVFYWHYDGSHYAKISASSSDCTFTCTGDIKTLDFLTTNNGLKLGAYTIVDSSGAVNAPGGFKDNGTAGIDTTFEDADGNTITVSGGIITAKTAP